MQTLTPITPLPLISQPERICVQYASYSAQPFTVTVSARVNQLKLKIKSHLILPVQTPFSGILCQKNNNIGVKDEGRKSEINKSIKGAEKKCKN